MVAYLSPKQLIEVQILVPLPFILRQFMKKIDGYIDTIEINGKYYALQCRVVTAYPIVCPKCGDSFELAFGKGKCPSCNTYFTTEFKLSECDAM